MAPPRDYGRTFRDAKQRRHSHADGVLSERSHSSAARRFDIVSMISNKSRNSASTVAQVV